MANQGAVFTMPERYHIREEKMKNNCPDEEILASYVEGLLTENERSQMEAHLAQCDTCREEFKLSSHLVRRGADVDIDMAPPEVTRTAIQLVNSADFASGGLLKKKFARTSAALQDRLFQYLRFPFGPKWDLATVRGNSKTMPDDLFHIKKNYREFDAEIEIEKTGENAAHIRVNLFGHNGCGDNIRITLKQGKRELCSSLSSHGHVLFEDISFGPYELIFDRDGVNLGAYRFDIKETHNGNK